MSEPEERLCDLVLEDNNDFDDVMAEPEGTRGWALPCNGRPAVTPPQLP